MKQFKLFSADVFADNIGTRDQREVLKQEALYHKRLDKTCMAFTNENCWRSRFKYRDQDLAFVISGIEQLVNQAMDYYSRNDPLFPEKMKSYGTPEIDYWTNINESHSKNSLHAHSLYHFVACFYIQAEGTGDLVYHNPANLVEECNTNAPFVSRMAFSPKDGDLFVWPAWVPHEVEMNFSDKQRINIAFNIRFQTPTLIENA